MSARELRQAFNEVMGREGSASVGLLEYERANDTEWQVLYFSGSYADGSGFSIRSDRIRPNGDVNQMARDTAVRVLAEKRST